MYNFDPKNIDFKTKILKGSTVDSLYIHNVSRGFGHTICNGIRRIILSYTPGIAVCGFYIDSIDHTFDDSINFVETVDEICENFRNIKIEYNNQFDDCAINFEFEGPGEITSQIIEDSSKHIKIAGNYTKILEVSKGGKYSGRVVLRRGFGFKTKDENREILIQDGYSEDKLICTTSVFSNIIRSNYDVDIDQIHHKAETIIIEYEFPSNLYKHGFIYSNAISQFIHSMNTLKINVEEYIDGNFFMRGVSDLIIEYLGVDVYNQIKNNNIQNSKELSNFLLDGDNYKNFKLKKKQVNNLCEKIIK